MSAAGSFEAGVALTRAGRFAAVLVMVAVLGWAGEGRADPSTGLVVSGVRTTSDQLAFYLTGTNLAAGAALTAGTVAVRVDGVPVATTVRAGVLPPVSPRASGVGEQPSRAVMVVLDARWPAAGEPLDEARAVIAGYVAALPGDVSAGLVVVSELVRVLVTPTTDRGVLTAALDGVTAQGDLPLDEGVRRALEYLPTPIAGGQRRMMLVSDGGPIGPPDDPETDVAVAALVPGSVPVDVVHTGAATVPPAAAPPELAGISQRSGGQFRAGSVAEARLAATAFRGSLVVSATTPSWFAGRATTVTVEATVAGRRLTAAVPVTFPAGPAAGAAKEEPGPGWFSGPIAAGVAGLFLLVLVIVWVRWALVVRARRRRLGTLGRYGKATVDGVVVAEPLPVPLPVRLDPDEVRAAEAVGLVATVAALAAAGLVSVRAAGAGWAQAGSTELVLAGPAPARPAPRLALAGPKPRLAIAAPTLVPTQRPASEDWAVARLADDTVRLPRVVIEPMPAAPAARMAAPMPVAMLAVLLMLLLGRLFGA